MVYIPHQPPLLRSIAAHRLAIHRPADLRLATSTALSIPLYVSFFPPSTLAAPRVRVRDIVLFTHRSTSIGL